MWIAKRRSTYLAAARVALAVGVLTSGAGCAADEGRFAAPEDPMTTLPVPANIPPFPLPDDIPRVQAPADVPKVQLPADIPEVPLPSAIPPIVFP